MINTKTLLTLLGKCKNIKLQNHQTPNVLGLSAFIQNTFSYNRLTHKHLSQFSSYKNSPFTTDKKPHSNPKQKQRFRDKYLSDYEFYKSVPLDSRSQELQRIVSTPSSKQQYPHVFKQAGKHKQEWFDYNGTKLKSYIWQTATTPKAVVVCYHSLNGHSLLISQFAQTLAKKGYIVAAIDYPNFGKSQGEKRGNIDSFSAIAEPSQKYLYHIKKQYPNTKVYLMGNSLGGAVAFCLANRFTSKELNGVIMLSPAIRQNSLHLPFRKKLAAILAITFPNFRLPKFSVRNGSKYKLDEYLKTDPYIYKEGMWTSTAWTMIATMLNFQKQFKELKLPYLIVQSGTDKLCDPFLAIDLQKYSPSKDKTTVFIHEMWHNVWLDQKKEDVIKIVQEWLEQRNP